MTHAGARRPRLAHLGHHVPRLTECGVASHSCFSAHCHRSFVSLRAYTVERHFPRRAFASEDRFPGVTLRNDWPDEALTDLAPSMRTAVVALTHDPKLDDPALTVALRSAAFYIGALGSRKTHASRKERMQSAGFNEEEFARIRGPVGLTIGARSPAEIAVSILAEITQTLREVE